MIYLPSPVFDIIKDYANFNPKKAFAKKLNKRFKTMKKVLKGQKIVGYQFSATNFFYKYDYNKHTFGVILPKTVKLSSFNGYNAISCKVDKAPLMWADEIFNPMRDPNFGNAFRGSDWEFLEVKHYERQLTNIINNRKEKNFATSLKDKTVKELKEFCRLNKIKGFSNKKKNELITHILKNY
jgi:hypothetical protein